MRHGDISNKPTPNILVRMDSTIFKEIPKDNVINKLRNVVGLKPTTSLGFQPQALSLLSHIAYRTDYNLTLVHVTGEDTDLQNKEKLLNDTLLDIKVITTSRDTLETLLSYMECIFIDNSCYRDKVYSLEEAIRLIK